eukprot:m.48082 g.48082  ORF g.48082 m.48082 type:complete len:424 (-) comp6016_c0_seq1:137-1408(-)
MSSFGDVFRVTTFGESHCAAVGVVIDGCPARMPLVEADIQEQLSRRRPGQSKLSTARAEADQVKILSGTEHGLTLGTPIALMVENTDHRPGDYASMAAYPRPSHADYTYDCKYGVRAASGGGRSSARETIGRVAAGAVAEKWLKHRFGIDIVAWVSSVGREDDPVDEAEMLDITRAQVDSNTPVRCANASAVARLAAVISDARDRQDSVGGTITCVLRGVPPGWGEPVFNKMEAALAQAMLSIPATKGFEIGSGFAGAAMRGSAHNDAFAWRDGRLRTTTNRSGGVQGGISNGEAIYLRVAFKPPATIGQPQETASYGGDHGVLEAKGRHDPCVVPRAVPIVEAMAALVLADMAMRQLGREHAAACFPPAQARYPPQVVYPPRMPPAAASGKPVEEHPRGQQQLYAAVAIALVIVPLVLPGLL